MRRICTTLAENGYRTTLVGYQLPSSVPLTNEKYSQKRIHCWFTKGKKFYAEYNIRLFFYLLFKKMDAICAIDLDTILPCLQISRLKQIPRIYDAHELFTELKEVVTRPSIKRMWNKIEKRIVPKFKLGYTVSESIAEEFRIRYKSDYKTIRNVPLLRSFDPSITVEKFVLYQGAVNEARGFEYLIPAMQWVNGSLVICGDGNFINQLKMLIKENSVENKVELKGMLTLDGLWNISQKARVGITIIENEGLNQYYSLPNKFFDYIHAAVPQVAMNYPEYQKINKEFEVAILLDDPDPKRIAEAINNLLADDVLYMRLKNNCLKARNELNWQNEQKKLLDFYQSVFTK
jgi:glycosyltransferase involved in cell wall biosynthesis